MRILRCLLSPSEQNQGEGRQSLLPGLVTCVPNSPPFDSFPHSVYYNWFIKFLPLLGPLYYCHVPPSLVLINGQGLVSLSPPVRAQKSASSVPPRMSIYVGPQTGP